MKMSGFFDRSMPRVPSRRLMGRVALGALLLACAAGISIGAAWSPEGPAEGDQPSATMVRIRPAESAEPDSAIPAVVQMAPAKARAPKPMPLPLPAEPISQPPAAGQICPALATSAKEAVQSQEPAGESFVASDELPVAEAKPLPRLSLVADETGTIRQPSIASAEPPTPRTSQPFALVLINMSPRSEALENKVEMVAAETTPEPVEPTARPELSTPAAPAMVLQFPDPSLENVKFRELPSSPPKLAEDDGQQKEPAPAADPVGAAQDQEKVRPAGILAEAGETLASDTQLVQMLNDQPEQRPVLAPAWRNVQPSAIADVSDNTSDGWRAAENSLPTAVRRKADVALFKSPEDSPTVAPAKAVEPSIVAGPVQAPVAPPTVRPPAYQVARSNVTTRVQPPIPADAGYAPALPPAAVAAPTPLPAAPMPVVQNGAATLASYDVSGCEECNDCAGNGVCLGCSLPQHLPYMPTLHGYYYFRPYNAIQVVRHQEFVSRFGGDTRNPYSNAFFKQIYDDYRASRPAMVKPAVNVPGR